MKKMTVTLSRSFLVAIGILSLLAWALPPASPAQASAPAQVPTPVGSHLVESSQVVSDGTSNHPQEILGASASDAPGYYETSAFMAGKVAVGLILPESIDGTESWTLSERQAVEAEVFDGLEAWEGWWSTLGGATLDGLDFVVDMTGDAVADTEADYTPLTHDIEYEPIAMNQSEKYIWINQTLAVIPGPDGDNYTDVSYLENLYAYSNDLREQNDADWAFVIFVVDSSEDEDGGFADGYVEYADFEIYKPVTIMTYDNGSRGINGMDSVLAHKTAYIFGAAYQREGFCEGATQQYGYLGIANAYCGVPTGEFDGRLMYDGAGEPDNITLQQVGWSDTDGDDLFDPIDTTPVVLFSPYPEDPTTQTNLVYEELPATWPSLRYRAYDSPRAATVCPHTDPTTGAENQCYYNIYEKPDTDPNPAVTINTIASIQYQVDGGTWLNATSVSALDSDYEQYSFSTGVLIGGKHTVKAQALNSRDVFSSVAVDEVTVAVTPGNDDAENAIGISSLNYDHAADVTSATVNGDPVPLGCGSGGDLHSVWYKYTPVWDNEIYLDTFGSLYDTVVSVWKSDDVTFSEDEFVGCSDDIDGYPEVSEMSFIPEAGATYYFMISEFNNSSAPTKKVFNGTSGPQDAILIFHASETKYSAHLPMLFKNAFGGTYDSAFYVQNTSATVPARAIIRFYNSAGVLECSVSELIKPLASLGWWLPGLGCLPDNWVGSVHVVSTQPVVAVARPHIGSEVTTYTGFTSGTETTYLPMLFKNAFGGSYQSAFYIQNVDVASAADLKIEFFGSDGSLKCKIDDRIPPLASKGWWVPSIACLPAGWVGSAVVTSTRNIITVGRPHVGNQVMTYTGFDSGQMVSYLPMLFKNAFGGGAYKSAFYIQNVHKSNSANVTIKYRNDAGVLNCTVTDVVAPLASNGYWLPSIGCLPNGWVGGVEVISDQPIVMVARPHVGTEITTYNSFAIGNANSFIPMLFKNAFGGSYDAAFYIQNVHPSLSANIVIDYYDSGGVLACTTTGTVPSLASKGYWLPAEGCLLNGWVGGVMVTSDQPIVAVGRPHIGAQVTTYSGFSYGSQNP